MHNNPYFSSVLLLVMIVSFATPTAALAGDCDGTTGDDTIICTADPTRPDDYVSLDTGNDTITLNNGVTARIVTGDGTENVYYSDGNGGDDTITINGTVSDWVIGDLALDDGGDDTITVNGSAGTVVGDYTGGNGGDDAITVNGSAGVVYGDGTWGDGGNDTIIINGSAGSVYGDLSWGIGNGGDDTITINGTVSGDVYGDIAPGIGGNDTVIIGSGATVAGTINGEDGMDILKFTFLRQSDLAGKDPAGDNLTYAGETYTWLNFEQLIGMFVKMITPDEEGGKSTPIYPSLPLNIVSITGGENIDLNCDTFRGTKLTLPDGSSLTVLCPAQGNVSSDPLASDTLPGDLPEGKTFASAINATLSNGGKLIVSFDIPDGLDDANLAILFWDGSQWVEVSGGHKTADGHFEASTNFSGTFVLVTK